MIAITLDYYSAVWILWRACVPSPSATCRYLADRSMQHVALIKLEAAGEDQLLASKSPWLTEPHSHHNPACPTQICSLTMHDILFSAVEEFAQPPLPCFQAQKGFVY